MADAVVAGASIAGLAAALALAGTGHRVRVLERSAPPPDGPIEQAASSWHRPTVPQAIHSHTLTSVGVQVLRTRAPRVLQAALAAGAELLDLTEALPPLVEDRTRQVDDDQLAALACRRSVLELVLYRAVRALPQVRIDHGITVRGLALDPSLRRVRAVLTSGGERLPAGLVVDATGRRADSRDWLAAAGVPWPRTSPTPAPSPATAASTGCAAQPVQAPSTAATRPAGCGTTTPPPCIPGTTTPSPSRS